MLLVGGIRAGQQQVFERDESNTMAELMEWIDRNLHREITIETLAPYLPVSERTLLGKFRDLVGMPPMTWVARRHMEHACQLLLGGSASVDDIAAHGGFGSTRSFRTSFTARYGTTPLALGRAARTETGLATTGSSIRSRAVRSPA